jgi:Fe-S-cluster containining protein
MRSLEGELARARDLDTDVLADAIEAIGFECTRCGACCKAVETDDGTQDHTATVFPDEVRRLQRAAGEGDGEEYDWRDVARPMPYGLEEGAGETFEWALRTDGCGDCVFYAESDGVGACTVHGDRPLICRTYPFSIEVMPDGGSNDADDGGDDDAVLGRTEPMGGVVEQRGAVRAHECEGLGRDIRREDAEELAAALKARAVRELEEAIAVRDSYEPAEAAGVVVHDSEGQKRPDGTTLGE